MARPNITKREIVFFWDKTPSMKWENSDGLGGVRPDPTTREDTLTPAVYAMMGQFYEWDTAGLVNKEVDEDGVPSGGALTFYIAGEQENFLGDLNQHNWTKRVVPAPEGGTYFMPQIYGWQKRREAEFSAEDSGESDTEKTTKCLIFATDGATDKVPQRKYQGKSDRQMFESWLVDPAGGGAEDILIVIAVVGNGGDTREAYSDYQTLSETYPDKIELVNCMGKNSDQIASEVLSFFTN